MEPTRHQTIRPKNMITALQEEVQKNKALNAVCHIFAIRERARSQVTLAALKQTMTKEGFEFSDKEYIAVLKFLADIGVGRLEKSPKGEVTALKDIKITLQSLGMAAVQKTEVVKPFRQRNRFAALPPQPPIPPPINPEQAHRPPKFQQRPQEQEKRVDINPQKVVNVALTATINGIPAVFVIAEEMPPASLGRLLTRLYDKDVMPQIE